MRLDLILQKVMEWVKNAMQNVCLLKFIKHSQHGNFLPLSPLSPLNKQQATHSCV